MSDPFNKDNSKPLMWFFKPSRNHLISALGRRCVFLCVCVWQHLYVCLSLLENNVFVFQQWYTSTMNLLGTWLTDRMDLQLHVYQLKILIRIIKKKYRDFRLQGVLDSTLNSKMYETVRNRLILEEATASVREGGMQGISMKDSDEEDD
ncbi:calcium-dependent secretion activator 1-like [Sinocyclocheilus rhinocerous]|uniref:calcium-dependent secretion activator 1-like n=1 Tax=Sinocyclocheilus rhinocerous TaxID=307959 RepID=UPI0007B80832|nr:PREDICTED: calcium-dependent secretion activator 1-like [Sinocyclocheilus rhinocerous]